MGRTGWRTTAVFLAAGLVLVPAVLSEGRFTPESCVLDRTLLIERSNVTRVVVPAGRYVLWLSEPFYSFDDDEAALGGVWTPYGPYTLRGGCGTEELAITAVSDASGDRVGNLKVAQNPEGGGGCDDTAPSATVRVKLENDADRPVGDWFGIGVRLCPADRAHDGEFEVDVTYQLGYTFDAGAERVMPLLLRFDLVRGPPGAYLMGIEGVTQGVLRGVFHDGEDLGPLDLAQVRPTAWAYGYRGFSWSSALDAARHATPIPFSATVEVAAGPDGAQQNVETVRVDFVVRLDGVATVRLLPAPDGRVRVPGEVADAELLWEDNASGDGGLEGPLPGDTWVVAKPGQTLRVYPYTEVSVRCLSGTAWRVIRGYALEAPWDLRLGVDGVSERLPDHGRPEDRVVVEFVVSTGHNERAAGSDDQRIVTRLVGLRSLGSVGPATTVVGMSDHELSDAGVFAVRMRSEVVFDLREDGGLIVRTLDGAPEIVGGDGTAFSLPAGYGTRLEAGSRSFAPAFAHGYRSVDELPLLPEDPASGDPDPEPPADGMTHTYGDASGWYLISVPVAVNVPAGETMWRWNPAITDYERPTTLAPTEGAWAWLDANTTYTVTATASTTPNVDHALENVGWHMVSAPWPYPRAAIRVTRGRDTKTWSDAVAAGWVRNALYGFQATDGAYTMSTTLHPWYGYWLDARVTGLSLRLAYGARMTERVGPACASEEAYAIDAHELPPLPPAPGAEAGAPLVTAMPNPVIGSRVTFQVAGFVAAATEALEVWVFDAAGRTVWWGSGPGAALDWHLNGVANGLYVFRVRAKVDGVWLDGELAKLLIAR